MNNIIPFNYKSQQIRVTQDEQGEPWWVAKDVCEVLEHSNHKMAIQGLDEDEVRKVYLTDSLGRKQETYIVNESGVYTLIFRSNKPQAKPFRKWVTSEVLPSIHKTGSYTVPETQLIEPETQPVDLVPLNRQFKAACSMAKLVGYEGNQAILAANKAVRKLTGQ